MALKPRDKQHGMQIQAGIAGRLRGHSFENNLSRNLNDRAGELCVAGIAKAGHLYEGDAATILTSYIIQHLGLRKLDSIRAFWLGGLATAGQGDLVLGLEGERVRRSKSDILLEVINDGILDRIGISVKTCFRPKPTNAQLFCSTASAICELFRRNEIPITAEFEIGLKMFCGDEGFRPLDSLGAKLADRRSDPERWFFEELPENTKTEIMSVFTHHQDAITRALLQRAYPEDPFPPRYVLHQRHGGGGVGSPPFALFHVDELIDLSRAYAGFRLKPYHVRKGQFKGDPHAHLAPRFGCIQFQRLGNRQNATQLQFNLEAGYFYKITLPRESLA